MIDGTRLATLRADTPGCESVIHLNNAGAALAPRCVVDTVVEHLREEAAIGGYEAAAKAADRLEAVYDSVAALISCHRDEVSLVESATRAWATAFYAVPFRRGDRVLTSRAEYVSNALAMLQLAERAGITVEVIEDDEHGQIDLDQLASRLDDDVRLVALTHVPTNGGLINPAAAVGRMARDAGALFLLDACQSAGQLPLDVAALNCDMLTATGRKFLRGPRGTGFLYVSGECRDELVPPLLDLRSATWTSPTTYEVTPDGRRFETFETSIASRLGLGAAIDYARAIGIEAISERARGLAHHAREALSAVGGVRVHDKGRELGAIVTFSVDGEDAGSIVETLRRQGINTWVSSATSAQLDMPRRGLEALVRVSPHCYNTVDEIGALATAVERLVYNRRHWQAPASQ